MIDVPFAQLGSLGDKVRYGFEYLGSVSRLAGATLSRAVRPPLMGREIFHQIEAIGVRSLAIAVLTAVFSSMVMTVQFAVQMARFGAKEYVGNVVSLSLVRELGPVLTALLVTGRAGSVAQPPVVRP